ncbi:MAG: acetyl-CoA carboxylase biotin carboxyl carrier protein [Azospirillaceae bacterium]
MAGFSIDDKTIRKLADLLNDTGLTEIEYSEGEKRIRIAKQITASSVAAVAPAAAPAAAPSPEAPAKPAAAKNTVNSPMVGTAYLSPEPGAAPYVAVGDTVREGQTVLIVEAMKVMNPIKAPQTGTVKEILVTDAQPVEFGEPLMVIE